MIIIGEKISVIAKKVREALSNVARHAQATQVKVKVREVGHDVSLTIRDDGVGFDPMHFSIASGNEQGLGLLGMRERVEQCQGSIEIESEPHAGTRIRVLLPLDSYTHAQEDQSPDR